MPPLKKSWRKREIERAEKKALKLFEQELKDAAKKEREVGGPVGVVKQIHYTFVSRFAGEKTTC